MGKRGRPTKTESILRKFKGQKFEPKTPIAKDFFLPNHSGDHSRGRVNTTPTTDYELVNKKFVDDQNLWKSETLPSTFIYLTPKTSTDSILTENKILFNVPGGSAETEYISSDNSNELSLHANNVIVAYNKINADGSPLGLDVLYSAEIGAHLTVGDKLKFTDTEYISQDNANELSLHTAGADVGLNIYSGANKMLEVRRFGSGSPTLTQLKAPVRLYFYAGGNNLAFMTSTYTFWNRNQRVPDNIWIEFGTGQDARMYYNNTNLVINPDIVGSGKVLIGATGDDDLNAANISIGNGITTPTLPLDVKAKAGISSIGGICIKLTNKTGANTVQGNLVRADTAVDDAFILTAAADDEYIGVVLEAGVADGSEAWIVVHGICDVLFDDNVAAVRANWVGTGQAGLARTQAAPPALGVAAHFEEVGHSIESVAATGGGTFILARCVLQHN